MIAGGLFALTAACLLAGWAGARLAGRRSRPLAALATGAAGGVLALSLTARWPGLWPPGWPPGLAATIGAFALSLVSNLAVAALTILWRRRPEP